jgi:hypothetical protein
MILDDFFLYRLQPTLRNTVVGIRFDKQKRTELFNTIHVKKEEIIEQYDVRMLANQQDRHIKALS